MSEIFPVDHTELDTNEMVLNMGPQHPSTHGVLRVILKLDGETVTDLDCDVGYLHRGVEKLAEARACNIILHITGVEVVSGVKNGQAESRSSALKLGDELWYGETFRNLQGERQKCWEAPSPVAWADKIQALINEGEREARSNLDQGREVDIQWHSQLAIHKEPMCRIKGLRPVLIRPNYERWKIAEKVIN